MVAAYLCHSVFSRSLSSLVHRLPGELCLTVLDAFVSRAL